MNARILLVDDHETNLVTLEAILAPEGYELRALRSGEEVRETALRFRPDLILLDVMMPGMDGYAVCRTIRETPEIAAVPVVMVTALSDRRSRIVGIEAGADDFISKPFSVEELRVRVRTITRLNRYRVIAEQRARLDRLFELAPSAIVVARPGGEVVSANRRAEEFFAGASSGSLRGRSLLAGLPAEEAERVGALIADAASGASGAGAIAELQLRLGDGAAPRVLHVSATRLEEGEASLALLSLDDITAEVRAREETESMNRRLDGMVRERTRRLEEANQLLTSYSVFVAHDLRSPLSAVTNYFSLLLSGRWELKPEVRACLEQAELAARMMEDMIGDTLSLACGPEEGEVVEESVDPAPVLRRLCGKLITLSPPPRPVVEVGPLPRVAGSALLIERVFFNLIANALKYASSRPDPRIEIGAAEGPEGPAIYVRDNGVGFPQEEAEALFAEFSRLSSAEGHEGLGLGLSLVARLVRSHHGRIWAEGRPGEGATFYVYLPPPPASSSEEEKVSFPA